MLGFFFRHYDGVVERYFVYDDGSEDESLDLLKAHPKVTLGALPYTDPRSRILSAAAFFDSCWQDSRGEADWVIVTDIDEHLYHPDLAAYIAACDRAGVTAVPALGFQMLADAFPRAGVLLCDQLRLGAPWGQMSKLNLFRPDAVARTNYAPGRHAAAPEGDIVLPARDDLMLLHYKYLDFERVLARHAACAPRSLPVDRERQYGHKYFWDRDRLWEDWQLIRSRLVDIAAPGFDAHRDHREPRWWSSLPRTR